MEKHAFAALFMAAFFPFTLAAQKADPATQEAVEKEKNSDLLP